jgi:hypothetical protein
MIRRREGYLGHGEPDAFGRVAPSGIGEIPLGLAKPNPFDKVRHFDVPDRGRVPWPAWVIACVREKAWPARTRPRTPARLYQRHVLAGLPNGRPQLQK